MNDFPIGERESQELEFKGRDVLADLSRIARETVGMLNATGGVIWIGIGESSGLATAIEPIEDSGSACRRLQDHLVDTIEPSPTAGEVAVDAIQLGSGLDGGVLRLRVTPDPARSPYAYIRGGGRFFVTRISDRLRMMSREEVLGRSGQAPVESALERAERELERKRAEAQAAYRGYLWLYLLPMQRMNLRFSRAELESRLRERSWTGDRPYGYRFSVGPSPVITSEKLQLGSVAGRYTTVSSTGIVQFTVPLADHLQFGERRNELNPGALIELPASILRLTSRLYRDCAPERPASGIVGDIAMFGVDGWSLRPGSLSSVSLSLEDPVRFTQGHDLVSEPPLSFSVEDILQRPGHCAFRLIRRVYAGFGLGEEEMPPEFDRETGQIGGLG